MASYRGEKYYQRLAVAARKAGLAKYDSRHLTSGQKANLTKLYDAHADIFNRPDEFIRKTVGKRTLKSIKEANLPEYRAIGGKVYIQKRGDISVKLTSNKNGDIKVSRKGKKKTTPTFTIHRDPLNIFKEIEKNRRRLKKLQNMGVLAVLTARFGDRPVFSMMRDDPDDMKKYLEKFAEDKLRYMSLVIWDAENDEEI